LLSRMGYNRPPAGTARNQMTQAKNYISTPDSTNDSTCTYDAVWNELATSPFSGSPWASAW
ncbi:MAG: hypothetical protein KJ050_15890, partial [Candidatus Omnitrophica bacterium]|nr:hypothetical protein [Candidatus Omnitrophota bacterium]